MGFLSAVKLQIILFKMLGSQTTHLCEYNAQFFSIFISYLISGGENFCTNRVLYRFAQSPHPFFFKHFPLFTSSIPHVLFFEIALSSPGGLVKAILHYNLSVLQLLAQLGTQPFNYTTRFTVLDTYVLLGGTTQCKRVHIALYTLLCIVC